MNGLSFRLSVVMAAMVTFLSGGCGGGSGSNPASSSGALTTPITATSTTAGTTTTAPTATPQPPTTSATPRSVSFVPPVIQLDNPGGSAKSVNKSQDISMTLTALDSNGNALAPSATNPMHVDVYGAPAGVITPVHQLCTTSTATWRYSGDDFPNNITVNCWIADGSSGAAIGVTQMLKKNKHPHNGTVKHDIYLTQTLPDALKIKAAVGYDASSADSALRDFTIDTGSLGVLVPFSELPKGGNVIGPGPEGTKFYSSSGNTYYGHFYLAPVSFKRTDGKIIQTIPIIVLAIESTACTGDDSLPCHKDTHLPSADLRYLGIGFNRNSTDPKDLFNSPTANAFLHITDADNGVNISPGYYLTPNDAGTKSGLSLGITKTDGYNVVDLSPNPNVAGDYLPQSGTFKFPGLSSTVFTGTALLDVGIDSMFLDAPKANWPSGSYDSNNKVPVGTDMEVSMGSGPAMSYKYKLKSPPDSSSPAPTDAKWIDTTKTQAVFINTGRRPLYNFDYFYNGQDGKVGFLKL